MAELVGLAASVAGLLSLGLQITGGIATYLDALESRQDELASIKRQNDALSAALGIIETATSRFQSPPHDRAVTTGIQSCKAELQAIEVLLADLANCDTSTWRQRLQSTKKKLSYAFDRSKVKQLAERLHHANEILQLTLTGLGLGLSGSSIDKLDVIESTSRSHASEILLLRSEVAAAITPASEMRDQIPLLQSGIDATSHLIVSHSTITSNQIQQSGQATLHSVERSHDSLQLTLGLQLQKMERLEQLLEGLRSNNPRDQSVKSLALRAASKPATLKELCDSVHAPGHDPRHHMSLEVPSFESRHETPGAIDQPQVDSFMRRICICHRPRLSIMQRRIQLGHFRLSQDFENLGHWPGCPLSKSQPSRKNRRAAGLQFTGLSQMLQSVIGISFAMTSGAGGFSIGPSFTYYPTVDYNSDPAFTVLKLIGYSSIWVPFDGNLESFLPACMRKLARLFDEKKAWPNATTLMEGNLLHVAMWAFGTVSIRAKSSGYLDDFFPKLVRTLLGYGVPAFDYNSDGFSPLIVVNREIRPPAVVEIINLLVRSNLESKPAFITDRRLYHSEKHHRAVRDLYQLSPSYADACGCGPLSIAVIHNNLSEVIRILDRSPESLSEVDFYGNSPLDLAASKAKILHRLLKVAIPNQLHQSAKARVSVLEKAMMLSSSLCINGSSNEICHGCDCVACIDLLLEAGCEVRRSRLDPFKLTRQPALANILEPASELARRRYVSRMAGSQNPRPFHSFGNNHPQDHWDIPEANFRSMNASTAMAKERLPSVRDSDNLRELAWVYDEIDDSHLAGLFYCCGIRPARSFPLLRNTVVWRYSQSLAAYLFWLLQHGLDLRLKLSTEPHYFKGNRGVGISGAHYAFYLLGRAIRENGPKQRGHPFDSAGQWTEVAKSVIRDNLTDGYECHCSMVECDPFLWFLKGMSTECDYENDDDDDHEYLQVWIEPMNSFYSVCGIELTALTFKATIRYATFDALKLTHTCCDTYHLVEGYGYPGITPWLEKDEVEAINEEQASLLKLHEELVAEFQEKASEYIKEGPNGSPRFPLFWREYWTVRMAEELQKLDGANLTDEERRGAEDVGVHWCEPPVDESGGTKPTNPYNVRTVEHWFFKLDSVCPELSEPWPEGLRRLDELS